MEYVPWMFARMAEDSAYGRHPALCVLLASRDGSVAGSQNRRRVREVCTFSFRANGRVRCLHGWHPAPCVVGWREPSRPGAGPPPRWESCRQSGERGGSEFERGMGAYDVRT